jgi:hypothetical protein
MFVNKRYINSVAEMVLDENGGMCVKEVSVEGPR